MGNGLRVLVVGSGSVGQRHINNLFALGVDRIVVYRTGKGAKPLDIPAGVQILSNLDEALGTAPDAMVVANPTALHVPTALAGARAGCHMLVEKPVSHTLQSTDRLVEAVRDLRVLVGFQFRFHPALAQIREWLKEGKIGPVVSVQAHYGEYLPGWHPWEDYTMSYSARPDLGGGVLLTLCHPFDYLHWLLGKVSRVHAMVGSRSGLELEVEDTADVALEFENGVLGHVHLDYIQRPKAHWMNIIGRKGTITWDDESGLATMQRPQRSTVSIERPSGFERNSMFMDEMKHFLQCVAGEAAPICTLHDGLHVQAIIDAAKQSARLQQTVNVQQTL